MPTATAKQRRQFHESVGFACESIDRTAGVIRGVKIVGLRSKNGRRYKENALREAISLYEGSSIFVNHPKGHPLSPRDYQDRIAGLSGVTYREGDGLYGDLSFNMKHPLAETAMWDAEHKTKGVGLSHNVLAESRRENGETVVESIEKVNSVDLVAGPATTKTLFESEGVSMVSTTLKEIAAEHKAAAGAFGPILSFMESDGELSAMPVDVPPDGEPGDAISAAIRAAVIGILDADVGTSEKLSKIKQLLKIGEAPAEKPKESGGGSTEVAASEQRMAAMERRLLAVSALGEQSIPFRQSLVDELVALPTIEAMRTKIESWPPSKVDPDSRPFVDTDVELTEQGSAGGRWSPAPASTYKKLAAR